ncbi:uncharacterized protein VTP21DRAFT_300 [Calcarisporiella thermophila]|uniref:uncharacterized protein n=1 Tax=Calcarisporiella thermophila TaxID=911321 RepID=UPI003744AF52
MHSFSIAILPIILLFTPASALYFILDTRSQTKCFVEQVPKDTIVSGKFQVEEWSEADQKFVNNEKIGVRITVQELKEMRTVLNLKTDSTGRFVFTSHAAGAHELCFTTNNTWYGHQKLRFHLEDISPSTSAFSSISAPKSPNFVTKEQDAALLNQIATRVQELNQRISHIRREQSYLREREALFRDRSETTNSKVVWWSVLQVAALVITCLAQLKAFYSLFAKKKVV